MSDVTVGRAYGAVTLSTQDKEEDRWLCVLSCPVLHWFPCSSRLSLLAVLKKSHLPPRLNRQGLRHNPHRLRHLLLQQLIRFGSKDSSRLCKTSRIKMSISTLISTTCGLMLERSSTRKSPF